MGLNSKALKNNTIEKIIGVSSPVNGRSTELAIGTLMPWNDKIWFTTYTAQYGASSGGGSGLSYIDDDGNITNVDIDYDNGGTWAGRYYSKGSERIFIGKWCVDKEGQVRKIISLPLEMRVTAICRSFNSGYVYFLGMEGELYEVDIFSLNATKITDLKNELGTYGSPHFKCMYMSPDRTTLFVGNNANTDEKRVNGKDNLNYSKGRLAYWKGGDNAWKILNNSASWAGLGGTNELVDNFVVAIGIDAKGALLGVANPSDLTDWSFKRLPTASRMFEHWWQAEWMRLRAIESERFMMDSYGMFYMVSPAYMGEDAPIIEPICRHNRIVPDFTTWKGHLILAGNQGTPEGDGYDGVAQSNSGMLFTHTDELFKWGKPEGYSDLWLEESVSSNISSDEMLINKFNNITVNISNMSNLDMEVKVEISHHSKWATVKTISIPKNSLVVEKLIEGMCGEWLRLTPLNSCDKVSAWVNVSK